MSNQNGDVQTIVLNSNTAFVRPLYKTIPNMPGETKEYIYEVTQINGEPLPDWINFEVKESGGTLTGLFPANAKSELVEIVFTTTVKQGGEVIKVFKDNINVLLNESPELLEEIKDVVVDVTNSKDFEHRIDLNKFSDPEKGDLTFELKQSNGEALPEWLTFDEKTGLLKGEIPNASSNNLSGFTITAIDEHGARTSDDFNFIQTVTLNFPPIYTEKLDTISVKEGESFESNLRLSRFSDPEGEELTFSLQAINGEIPEWIDFDLNTGSIKGIAPVGSEDLQMQLIVTDAHGLSSIENIALDITYENMTLNTPWYGGSLHSQSGNDTLKGSWFSDTLFGHKGDDTYYVNRGDKIIERTDEGIDMAIASTSYTLDQNVENLILEGFFAKIGVGNELDNSIEGNYLSNNLYGMEGDDTLIGNKGNDLLVGGRGNDSYIYNLQDGYDTIHDNDGESDTLNLQGDDLAVSDVLFNRGGDDLFVSFDSSRGHIKIADWFLDESNQVESVKLGNASISNTNINEAIALSQMDSEIDMSSYWRYSLII